MRSVAICKNSEQDNSGFSSCTASVQDEENERAAAKVKKYCETSPAVSRYGRTHKPKISEDFLPTDKKVGAILGLSPKTRSSFDVSHSFSTSPNKAVEKGRIVHELLKDEKKISTRGRKPKLKFVNSLHLERSVEHNNESHCVKALNEVKSEVSTSEKTKDYPKLDVKVEKDENVMDRKAENEIMSPDVTSSVDDNVLSESRVGLSSESSKFLDCGWVPGDLAWARVGGHPFWPCMVAVDSHTGEYTKIKRVGRGLSTVQRSLHVQFFGDNGRHSWVSTNCVIKFEGKDGLQNFADKVLSEIKKKDKKFSSAFVIRPSSKVQWDCAVQEAEEAFPKTNKERIHFFEENFPPEKYGDDSAKTDDGIDEEGARKSSRSFKRKRNSIELDEKPHKQMKIQSDISSVKIKEEKDTISNNVVNATQRKQKLKKHLKKEPYDFRIFADKYSKHASEIHPGLSDENLQKLMVRMWSAMDESEKAVYKRELRESSEESLSTEDDSSDNENRNENDNDNDNDNSSDSTRESTPSLAFAGTSLKKAGGLFRGTRQEKVCQICWKPGNTVKCKGSCLGVFHVDCIKYSQVKSESTEVEVKKKRGRPKSSKNENLTGSENEEVNINDDSDNAQDNKVEKTGNEDEREKEVGNEEGHKHSPVEENESGEFRCRDCAGNRTPVCFVCSSEKDPKTNSDLKIRCVNGHCGKFYHLECVKLWPQASCTESKKQINGNKNNTASDGIKNLVLTCPQHVCHTCASDDPRNATMRFNHERLVRCILCPTTYHTGNYCVPAGSEILTGSQIICPRHYEPPIKGSHHVNAAWCFICAMVGGSLICCDLCPTSFHAECLRIAPPEDGYICEDCDTGRYPLYGEVVWVKLGAYRWWPAQILFPNQMPDNVKNLPHKRGEFAVRFFGSHDHYWVNRGRVFLYQEGDTGHKSAKKTSVDGLFQKALTEAAEAHKNIRVDRSLREAEARPGMKPPSYVRIKANKPVGNVRVYEVDPASMTPCECDPESKNPCGVDSDCLNRILMVECTPGVCAAGDRCGNQCFMKRQYPPLEPFRTESRGWGLRALKSLRKGEFVIEYVGEMIDEAEYRQRLDCKHREKDENYYFLTIDNHRLLDAGPKGNVARFMNHSCQPNCETQKWTVNGDTRVGLFALQDIPKGEELTFNYNLECVGPDKKPCMCGAPNCSGYIGVKVSKLVEDDKRTKVGKQDNQRAKRKRKRQYTKSTDIDCFECGLGGELLLCDNKTCPKGYHLSCAKRKTWPKGKWLCPWHLCDICQRRTGKRCAFCPRSFCIQHADGNIRLSSSLGMVCGKHDEDQDKALSNAYNEILEDVEICLKGISSIDNKGATLDETLMSKPNNIPEVLVPERTNDKTNTENSLQHGELLVSKSACNSVLSHDLNVLCAPNGSSPLLIKNNDLPKKKRGRPRKYPLSPPTTARYEAPKLTGTNDIKTPDFIPKLENVSTIKKRGRKRKIPLSDTPADVTALQSNTDAQPIIQDQNIEEDKLENRLNSPQELKSEVTNNTVSPRTSNRKRQPSEKLAAYINSQFKSAKRRLNKTLDNYVFKLESNPVKDLDNNDVSKFPKNSDIDLDSNSSKVPPVILDKKPVGRPKKTLVNRLDKNYVSKSYNNSNVKHGKNFHSKAEMHNLTKSTKVYVTKTAKSPVKKSDKIYITKAEKVHAVRLGKNHMHIPDKNLSKTSNYMISKIDRDVQPFFKSYQNRTPKKTILQRIDHKPDVRKFSLDCNSKLLSASVTESTFLSRENDLTTASTSKRIIDNINNQSLYQKAEINGMHDISANDSILESFDDDESRYFKENVTTIPINEFLVRSNPPGEEFNTAVEEEEAEAETETNLDSELIPVRNEETTEKLSEDGKYQILTNMRPDSLDIEKPSSVLMGVDS